MPRYLPAFLPSASQPPPSPSRRTPALHPRRQPDQSEVPRCNREAKKCVAQHQFTFAKDAYKKANKIAGGQDSKSLQAIFDLQLSMGEYKDAVATATHIDEIAVTPIEKASAEVNRGQALLLQAGEKGKPELVQAARYLLKAAIVNNPKNGNAHYFDGYALARLGQTEAASQQFKECLSCISPKDPSYLRAQHFAENPALSTSRWRPHFRS